MQSIIRITIILIAVSLTAPAAAVASNLNDPIRLLEQNSDDNIHSGKVDEAVNQLQQAIALARQNSKNNDKLAHLMLKRMQLIVNNNVEKVWSKELLRLMDEKEFINKSAARDPELLIDIDDLYDSVRLRSVQAPSLVSADCLESINLEFHHEAKYGTEALEVRMNYYKKTGQWHQYELIARQAAKMVREPRDVCSWLTYARHACLMQKKTAEAAKLYKDMSAQLDRKYNHKDNGWHVVMAADLFDSGDVDEAESTVNEGIEQATKQHQNLSELLSTRAVIYDYRKLYDKEEVDLKASFACATIREDKIGSLQSLEQLYIKQKRKSEAMKVRAQLTKAKGYMKWHGD